VGFPLDHAGYYEAPSLGCVVKNGGDIFFVRLFAGQLQFIDSFLFFF